MCCTDAVRESVDVMSDSRGHVVPPPGVARAADLASLLRKLSTRSLRPLPSAAHCFRRLFASSESAVLCITPISPQSSPVASRATRTDSLPLLHPNLPSCRCLSRQPFALSIADCRRSWDALTGRQLSAGQRQDDSSPQAAEPSEPSRPSLGRYPYNFDPSQLHPLAGLNKGSLDYLSMDDAAALSELPGAQSALPSRGWADDVSYIRRGFGRELVLTLPALIRRRHLLRDWTGHRRGVGAGRGPEENGGDAALQFEVAAEHHTQLGDTARTVSRKHGGRPRHMLQRYQQHAGALPREARRVQ